MELQARVLRGQILDPAHGFSPARPAVEVRWDPLTGHTSRLVRGGGLMPAADFDLGGLADDTRASCPFCPERVERVTPKLPAGIHPDGRIRHGQALLFPNLLPYAQYSSVAVYAP